MAEEGSRRGNDLQPGLFKKSPGTWHVEGMGDEDDATDVGGLEYGGREGGILGSIHRGRFLPAHSHAQFVLQDAGHDLGFGAAGLERTTAGDQHGQTVLASQYGAITGPDQRPVAGGIAAIFCRVGRQAAAEDDDGSGVRLALGQRGVLTFQRPDQSIGDRRDTLRGQQCRAKDGQSESPASASENAGHTE